MTPITAIPEFIQAVLEIVSWNPVFPWFRGEPANATTPLLPKVFRKKYDENNLLQTFRRRAHLLNLPVIPPLQATDQWLFLARHVGLPTRLLDWCEGRTDRTVSRHLASHDTTDPRQCRVLRW